MIPYTSIAIKDGLWALQMMAVASVGSKVVEQGILPSTKATAFYVLGSQAFGWAAFLGFEFYVTVQMGIDRDLFPFVASHILSSEYEIVCGYLLAKVFCGIGLARAAGHPISLRQVAVLTLTFITINTLVDLPKGFL